MAVNLINYDVFIHALIHDDNKKYVSHQALLLDKWVREVTKSG